MNMETKKKKVILRGPLLTQSGYGVHARQVASWLFSIADQRNDLEIFCEPLPWGITPWILETEAHNGLIGRIVQSSTKAEHYDVSLQLQLPNEWNPFLADYNIGITAAVEADKCNPEWITACNRMDMVIVPSEFTKNVLMNSGEIKTKLVVIPESFIDECLDDSISGLDNLVLDKKTNFLIFSQITGNNPENDRKNIFYTIKWLNEVFKDNPDVGIVIKTNLGRQTILDQINCVSIITKVVNETKIGTNGPSFYLLHGDMTNKEVVGLYRHPKIKALISLTHGEGFGLPILEAAANGLPVIVTNWSAHTEFLSKGKFVKIDYNLGPVHESKIDGQIYQNGFKWAYPSEEDFKRKINKFVESPVIPQTWAKELSEKLKAAYSSKSIYELYSKELETII